MFLFCYSYECIVLEIGKEGNKAKRKECVVYTIKNMVRLIEIMVRGAILLNVQEDLIAFSNHLNKHVFSSGADRGGNDLIDMVRYVNRTGGNSGDYTVPLTVAEDAAETNDNLFKSIYREEQQTFLQTFLD
jgi:hypothetical protein